MLAPLLAALLTLLPPADTLARAQAARGAATSTPDTLSAAPTPGVAPAETASDSSASALAAVDRVMQRAIAAGGFPGAAVAVGRADTVLLQRGYGRLGWGRGSPRVAARSTLYDLASLTKVVATTTAAMILVDDGRLDLDAPVARYLPAFGTGAKSRVTVRDLLLHRSGLPAGMAVERAHTPAEARRRVLATPLVRPPGTRTVYSDVGAEVLALALEAAAGEPLDRFLARRVFAPLGMRDTRFRPRGAVLRRTAPTMPGALGDAADGRVHDENARALGGVAGHAGLFSTASDLRIFAQMMLNGGSYNGVRIVSDSVVWLFTTALVRGRALGWERCLGGGSCGFRLSGAAFGHTGYTGTSIWIDPARQLFVIVLTNWVHTPPTPRADPWAVIADVRADVADVAADAVDGRVAAARALRADRAIGWRLRETGDGAAGQQGAGG